VPGFTVAAVNDERRQMHRSRSHVRSAQNNRANTVAVKTQMFPSSKASAPGWSGAAVKSKRRKDRRTVGNAPRVWNNFVRTAAVKKKADV